MTHAISGTATIRTLSSEPRRPKVPRPAVRSAERSARSSAVLRHSERISSFPDWVSSYGDRSQLLLLEPVQVVRLADSSELSSEPEYRKTEHVNMKKA